MRWLGALLLCIFPAAALAQVDPLSLPSPRPASRGAYQWGIEMLKFDRAWSITRGRAHVAVNDLSATPPHEDVSTGLDGPLRPHLSMPMAVNTIRHHTIMVVGVLAARGMNGKGVAGACPLCSVSLHDGGALRVASFNDAIESGAVAINLSAGGVPPDVNPGSCAAGSQPASQCRALARMEERDVVYVTIAGNNSANRIGDTGNFPSAMVIGGLQPDGKFWTEGYDRGNTGSSWGPELRIVAPSRDVLLPQPPGATYFTPDFRCGDRVDSLVGQGVSLGTEYTGYGDCNGTSFAAPHVSGLVGLMRSANPLLTAAEVRGIIYDTAKTPVAAPDGFTVYIPDAEAAVKRAIGPGQRNRITPMFSLYASEAQKHLFTSTPQVAVAGAAGELRINGLSSRPRYASFGDPVPGYPQFKGRLCDSNGGSCTSVDARSLFSVFTTENSPDGTPLVPLYRLSQSCTGAGCASVRAFAYATSDSAVRAFEQRGYSLDMVEGYVYAAGGAAPAGSLPLCLAFDATRIDHILYAATSCNRTQLGNSAGANTGGNYVHVAQLGFAPEAPPVETAVNHTGLWWNPAESGWGINFTHQGNILFGTLFTYDASRRPLWLVMSGGTRQGAGPGGLGTFGGTLYRTTGPAFNANPFTPIGPSNLTTVGSMQVAFGPSTATLTYDVNGASVTKTIQKQLFGTRAAECLATTASTATRTEAENYQDLWWNPSESGWGINITHQDSTLFATLFTYAADGAGLWLVMSSGRKQADGSWIGDLYRTTGSAFNAQPFVPLTPGDLQRVGSMRLTFQGGAAATLAYDVDGVAVTKSIVRQVFASPVPECGS